MLTWPDGLRLSSIAAVALACSACFNDGQGGPQADPRDQPANDRLVSSLSSTELRSVCMALYTDDDWIQGSARRACLGTPGQGACTDEQLDQCTDETAQLINPPSEQCFHGDTGAETCNITVEALKSCFSARAEAMNALTCATVEGGRSMNDLEPDACQEMEARCPGGPGMANDEPDGLVRTRVPHLR